MRPASPGALLFRGRSGGPGRGPGSAPPTSMGPDAYLVARHRITSYAHSIKLSHPPPLTWASGSDRRVKIWVVQAAAPGAGGREFSMTEHAGLIQVTTFRPAPGRRDEVLALCAQTQERAAAADGCFGAQTCTVDEDPDAVVAISRWRDRHSLEAFQAAEGGSPPIRVRDVLIDAPVTRQYAPVG
jgi:quinol monooxygenase YgiN